MKRQKSNNILWIVLGLAAVGGLTYVVIKKTKQNKQPQKAPLKADWLKWQALLETN